MVETHVVFIISSHISDMLLQIFRHSFRKVISTLIEIWLPSEDLVQLQKDAGCRLVVGEVVVLCARTPCTDVDVADLAGWRR